MVRRIRVSRGEAREFGMARTELICPRFVSRTGGRTYGESRVVVWSYWACPECGRLYRLLFRLVSRQRRDLDGEHRRSEVVPYVSVESVCLLEEGGGQFEACRCGYRVPRGMEAFFEAEGPDVEYRVRLAALDVGREPGVRAVA